MLIGIDISMVDSSKAGIGHLTYSIVKSLSKLDNINSYLLYTNNSNNLKDLDLPDNFKIIEIPQDKTNLRWILTVHGDFTKRNIDIFISTSNLMFGVLFPNTITFIQDLSPVKFPHFFSRKGSFLFKILLNLLLRREKIIVTTSTSVKNEVIEYYPKAKNKIFAVGAGVNSWAIVKANESDFARVKEKYNLPEKYFLSVSTLEPRKNYINAIKGFAEFSKNNPEYQYLIVGKKGWFYDEIFQTVKMLKIEDKVRFLGYAPDEDLPPLYDLSSGVVYLSIYEGFGLPVVESYYRGIPSLVSNIPVFKEIAKEHTIFSDPNNIQEIANKMGDLKELNKFQPDQKVLKEFTWDKVANNLIQLYNRPLL